jgi:NADH:ubiquinone oxidoreductase subunit 4 (subunit M)
LASLILAIIGLGVYPIPFIDVIKQAAAVLPSGPN